MTEYHSKYFAHEITRQASREGADRLSMALFDANVDLNPHQIEAALFALRSPVSKGVILADEVGLGKTIEAALVLCQLWAERKRRLLVICPASLRKQWTTELEEKFNLPATILDAKSFNAARREGRANPFELKGVVVCSMHFAARMQAEVSAVPWNLVVVDEAHKLRNAHQPGNKMGQAIRQAISAQRKILLTATPLQNSLMELYGMSSVIDEYMFGEPAVFRSLYCGQEAKLDDLRARLSGFCKRTLRKDVLEYVQYTQRRPITQRFKPTDDEHRFYEAISEFLQRPDTFSIPARQQVLLTLRLRKILASSSPAVAGTLRIMRQRLSDLKAGLKPTDFVGKIIAGEDLYDDDLIEEFEDASSSGKEERGIDVEKLDAEILEYTPWGGYPMELTPAQKQAVEHDGGNLQLIACAGSGKTEVVARRVVHLLTPGRADSLLPRNIVAFTFTEKAAAELKERIVTRTREALGDVPGMAEMFVGTIHAFCLELLKSEVPEFLKFGVLNEVQQSLFVDRHSTASGLTSSTDLEGAPLRRYQDTRNYTTALGILREADRVDASLANCSVLGGLDAYSNLLNERRYFDYSSILEEAITSLTNDQGLKDRIGERVKYVIVDEYQDVNPVQEAIVWLLHDLGAKICVVGDDDQTIYQWRGSDVNGILSFADRYPDVTKIPIEENFRSSDGIVETARPFIEQNGVRLPKAMKPTGAQPYEAGDIVALNFTDPETEARHIAETAASLRGVAFNEGDVERGLAWSDMAILLRSVRANGEPITRALQEAGIPYVVTGMNNLFGTGEAEAARHLFYFIADHLAVDEAQLEAMWVRADLGLDWARLRAAIAAVSEAKAAFSDPDQKRWGQYSIQRVFLDFLESCGLIEEDVPNGRGEVVFYNLGKFSQLISDFEQIHFHSSPKDKYDSFANFLQYRAEDYYPEGWQDNQYANPDAVRIMTVHQSKGMQWPVVFLPALLRNRFPAPRIGGRSVWHLIPRAGIAGQARYEGTIEDERRLFYVAMTRSQKFLHMTWAPIGGGNRYTRSSEFWDNILVSKYVKRTKPDYSARPRLEPRPRAGVANVVFSFSDLKYFFECPYQFKLRVLYGFNAPLHEALGYGKSLHDALAEVHMRATHGDIADPSEVNRLVETHLHVPFAYPALRQTLEASAERVIRGYMDANANELKNIEFSEKQIEISLGDGISIIGRIDLVRRKDTNETTIVDLKSSDRAQAEDVTEAQLHTYALGYRELTGRDADYVEIYELDEGKRKPRSVDDDFIEDVKAKTRGAADALRNGNLPMAPTPSKCAKCDYRGMCSAGRAGTP